MPGRKNELINLIKKYRLGKASPQEVDFLEKYYQYFDKEAKISQQFSETEKADLGRKIFSAIQSRKIQAPVIPIHKRKWFRVAAASVLVFFAGSVYFILRHSNENVIAKTEPQETRFKNDVAAPASTTATITLADGRVIPVDSLTSLTQNGVNVTKTVNGKIIYNGSASDMVYNTLSNPRGSKVIDMQLSDGSHVWLNAGSSVTYPVAFIGKERNVSITGEAYFEVARNTAMPFKVTKGDMAVAVLGTHFNVNAYDDETDIKVTLLEGSVKVSQNGQDVTIKPGQQAVILSGVEGTNKLQTTNNIDLDEVMAWKNGRFYFDGADIKTMMRQLSRWYNVEVEFKADIKYSFVAKISRDEPVSALLKILELTNAVHFKIEGNKIEVLK